MKKKPILIIAAILVVSVSVFLFIRYKKKQAPGTQEVLQFITDFNYELKGGKTELIRPYFDNNLKKANVTRLINILSGHTGLNGKTEAHFNLTLDPASADISIINDEYAKAIVAVNFSADGLSGKQTAITLKIHKRASGKFKINAINMAAFVKDYIAFESGVRTLKPGADATVYSAITLAAFKVAEQLKTKYDSVLWFQHLNNQTYYFVSKTKIEGDFWSDKPKGEKKEYNIGLVNPSLKEIIPPQYDLIHNISGTIAGLVEVEKGTKKGLYDLEGKNVLAVDYDEIYPLNEGENAAVLLKGDDYYYLKKDFSVTDKLTDFKIAAVLPSIKSYGRSYTLSDSTSTSVMEYNSHSTHNSLLFPASYLVGWQLLPRFIDFPNPLRKVIASDDGEGDADLSYQVSFDGKKEEESNWFTAIFNSIVDDYIGGRGGLYQSKTLLVVDKRKNKILSYKANIDFGESEGGVLSNLCEQNSVRAINDSLLEYKTTSIVYLSLLNDSTINQAPYYHYLQIKNGKLEALPNGRIFGFTKYVKMNDSYLNGCFVMNEKSFGHMTPEMLQYAKNEIYASYKYKFKSEKWQQIFSSTFDRYNAQLRANVDDSLTVIDKYNIDWIAKKLQKKKLDNNTLALR